jgi:hypothetical protein
VIFVYLLLFLLGILLVYLVLSLMAGHPLFVRVPDRTVRGGGGKKQKWGLWKKQPSPDTSSLKTCPVCGSLLEKGQLVKSVVFQGGVKSGNITERMSHIFGCPYCYPANNKNLRICPVCRQIIPVDGYLIARMFEKTGRERKHVHVLGCTACRVRTSGQ